MPTATRYDISGVVDEHGTERIADRCGVSRRTVQRWIKNGVDVYTADKIAVKVVGDTPHGVWGRSWE